MLTFSRSCFIIKVHTPNMNKTLLLGTQSEAYDCIQLPYLQSLNKLPDRKTRSFLGCVVWPFECPHVTKKIYFIGRIIVKHSIRSGQQSFSILFYLNGNHV